MYVHREREELKEHGKNLECARLCWQKSRRKHRHTICDLLKHFCTNLTLHGVGHMASNFPN